MKYITFLSIIIIVLSGCSNTNTIKDVSDAPIDILESSVTEKPEYGDIFIIETDKSETFIFAYIEKDSEVEVNKEKNVLNIEFDEPGQDGAVTLYTLEFDFSPNIDTLTFYINGNEKAAKKIITE